MPGSMAEDYYEVLGIDRSASADDIRRAYRNLAREYHPDVNKGADAAARFKAISEAYEVLSDEQKRQAYDRFGKAGLGAGGPGQGGPHAWTTSESFGGSMPSDFGDLFEQMFSGAGGSPFGATGTANRPRRGEDTQQTITVSFLTAALGGTETVTAADGSPQRIEVRIPAGTESGTRLRVRDRGRRAVPGGPPGDLIVTVEVGQHPYYTREGLDLSIDVPVTFAEAALGTTLTVPLLKGTVELKVPPGTSSGQRLRVKGQGITDPEGRTGDFYAVVQIVAPRELSERGRAILEELADELKNPRDPGSWPAGE